MVPRKLMEQLAPYHPIMDGEWGNCLHCGGENYRDTSAYHYGRSVDAHLPGCPWVKARRLLGDKLPRLDK